jgi:hypothetical protein
LFAYLYFGLHLNSIISLSLLFALKPFTTFYDFRTAIFYPKLMRYLYEKTRLPMGPIFGGFPVKLRTYVGKPIPYESTDTPEILRDKVKDALQGLISAHQRVPGSIVRALFERFSVKKHSS